jgi:hypothetical protein
MKVVTQKNTQLGDILQSYCITVLEEVMGNIGKGLKPVPNGNASARVALPGDISPSYLYLGFDNKGFLLCQYWGEMAGGEPDKIYGPIALSVSVRMPIGVMAQHITHALPKKVKD